jgi:hypothetical protein
MKISTTPKAKERVIYRYEDTPGPKDSFKVPIPWDQDFIVRHRTRSGRIWFYRGIDGGMTAFADPKFEIELLETDPKRFEGHLKARSELFKTSKGRR